MKAKEMQALPAKPLPSRNTNLPFFGSNTTGTKIANKIAETSKQPEVVISIQSERLRQHTRKKKRNIGHMFRTGIKLKQFSRFNFSSSQNCVESFQKKASFIMYLKTTFQFLTHVKIKKSKV